MLTLQNSLAYMPDFIVMQVSKVNREKDYCGGKYKLL